MELFYVALVCLGFFLAGYIVGLLQNGIKISHKQEQPEFQGYNEPVLDNLDPQVKEYLDRAYGNIHIG